MSVQAALRAPHPLRLPMQVNASDASAVNAYGRLLSSALAAAQATNPLLGGSIDACSHHCSRTLWYTMDMGGNVTEGGAFQQWYATRGSPRRVWEQNASYPCASCCSGGGDSCSAAAYGDVAA